MEGDWISGLELGLEHGVGTLWTQSGAQLHDGVEVHEVARLKGKRYGQAWISRLGVL
uniref:Uncharacterized protein n=1 Tax=Aegilops tauschii TaxID=37682 RepID=R7W0B0_AEGTA